MKKIIALLFIALFTAAASADGQELQKNSFLECSLQLSVSKESKPVSGRVTRFYPGSQQYEIDGYFVNGKAQGMVKGYYKDGTLKYETPYTDGKLDGRVRTYDENGVLEYEFNFTGGKAEGTARKYYPDGALRAETVYKNNKLNGFEIVYDKNGVIESRTWYKNNLPEGIAATYYENGKVRSEVIYANGKAEGILKIYFENGKPEAFVYYKKDIVDGHATVFNENDDDFFIELIYKNGIVENGYFVYGSGKRKELRQAQINKCEKGLSLENYVRKSSFFILSDAS